MPVLQISNSRERRIVAAADAALAVLGAVRWMWRAPSESRAGAAQAHPAAAARADRRSADGAAGDRRAPCERRPTPRSTSWSEAGMPIWLARFRASRESRRSTPPGWPAGHGAVGAGDAAAGARHGDRARYDLAINFEPDIRSNLLLAASGAAFTAGYCERRRRRRARSGARLRSRGAHHRQCPRAGGGRVRRP